MSARSLHCLLINSPHAYIICILIIDRSLLYQEAMFFLADAIAGDTPAKLGKDFINHVSHTLILENVLSELIPPFTWHLRKVSNPSIPLLELPWTYQHHYQLHKYLHDRDAHAATPSTYWQSTAIEFMNAVHPLPPGYRSSYWHAARRSIRIFDWIGHGRNRAKHSPRPTSTLHPTPILSLPCPHCGLPDDQVHLMLICSLPSLLPIRQRAKRLQSFAGSQLRIKFKSAFDHYLIDQILIASWRTDSVNTRRLWLGMWSAQLLTELLPSRSTITQPMLTPDRYKYRKIIRQLTFPLTYAYRQLLKLHRPYPSMPPTTTALPTLPGRLRHRTGLLLHQDQQATPPFTLHLQQAYINPTAFTFSDAANSISETNLGLHKNITPV